MKIEKEKFYLKNNSTIDKRMCELQKHDVISIIPHNHINKYTKLQTVFLKLKR